MWKWIRRTIYSLLGAILLMILFIVGVVLFDAQFGAKATDFTNITYPDAEGTTLNAYLAMPEGEGIFPAVIMVHEWWGLNQEIAELADDLAAEGYVVLAPDTYRGATTSQIPRALYLRLTVDEAQVDTDMMTAFAYLAALPNVDAENIGVIGFCYGGGVALRHAVLNPNIAATIDLYGDTIADPNAFGALLNENAGAVLGIFGAMDESISLTEVAAFEEALSSAGVEHQISIYDDVGHAFVQPDAINEEGSPQEAWQEILNFFDTHLRDNVTATDS